MINIFKKNKKMETTKKQAILTTYAYEDFNFLKGNRHIRSVYVGRLKTQIKLNDLTSFYPIICDNNYTIFDGQHRFTACSELGLPIYYLVIDNMTLREIVAANMHQQKWVLEDYLNSYCELGIKPYLYLRNFINQHTWLKLSTAIIICQGGKSRGTNQFKNGKMNIDETKDHEVLIGMLADFKGSGVLLMSDMVQTIINIYHIKGYNHKQMMRKLKRLDGKIPVGQSVNDSLRNFEEIYNKGSHATKLRFF